MTESKTTATTSKEGTEVKQKITRKKQLFLLFYTTGNSRGDNVMYHSAKTRRENIVKSGCSAHDKKTKKSVKAKA